eukprot:766991-Hanusia_phi.AAC.4
MSTLAYCLAIVRLYQQRPCNVANILESNEYESTWQHPEQFEVELNSTAISPDSTLQRIRVPPR